MMAILVIVFVVISGACYGVGYARGLRVGRNTCKVPDCTICTGRAAPTMEQAIARVKRECGHTGLAWENVGCRVCEESYR